MKTVGLYGELNQDFGPDIPERAVWDKRAEKEFQIYMALRPDSFCEWSVKNRMEELSQEDTHKSLRFWYDRAVEEQRAELRQYKKKLKAHEAGMEPVPLTVEPAEEELTQAQGN